MSKPETNPYEPVAAEAPRTWQWHPSICNQIMSASQLVVGLAYVCLTIAATQFSLTRWINGDIIQITVVTLMLSGLAITAIFTSLRNDWSATDKLLYVFADCGVVGVLIWIVLSMPF